MSLTGIVQQFGGALLGAIEKRDTEKLSDIQAAHQRELLQMTTDLKEQGFREAKAQVEELYSREGMLRVQKKQLTALQKEGLMINEVHQLNSVMASSTFLSAQAIQNLIRIPFCLTPDGIAPWAVKYGGENFARFNQALSDGLQNAAHLSNAVAASTGLQASFNRREQGWRHQIKLLDLELLLMSDQIDLAIESETASMQELKMHQKELEHSDRMKELLSKDFTGLGFYNWLVKDLQKLYREAYTMAYKMAKMAESAYRYERSEDTNNYIMGTNWDTSKAGLMAGERLMMQLQKLDNAYTLGTEYKQEVEQTFSVLQINPEAIMQLRKSGTTEFTIPELVFDMLYPGYYRREIKSVSVTIPCVTGPYVNVGANLSLLESKIRLKKAVGDSGLTDVKRGKQNSIATSHAKSDGGVLDMSFAMTHYVPFEGAGAVNSKWRLEMPAQFRQFDYNTISDVLIHISYTSKYDGAFKTKVEADLKKQFDAIASRSGLRRLFNLNQEFSNAYHTLVHQNLGKDTHFKLLPQHFPHYLADHFSTLKSTKVYVMLKLKPGKQLSDFKAKIYVNDTQANFGNASNGLEIAELNQSKKMLGDWSIKLHPNNDFDSEDIRQTIEQVFLLVDYKL